MNKKHLGAFAEIKATAWLLEQGYEVFANVSQHGDVDLIALNPDTLEVELFDVTTGRYYIRKDGTKGLSFAFDKLNKIPEIKVLVFIKETEEVLLLKEDFRADKNSTGMY